ncbi:MAG TPA: MFS transporter [Dehalococcoidia bacterium]
MEYKVYKYRWVILAVYMYVAALTQLYWLNFAAIDTFIEEHLGIAASSVQWLTVVFPLVQVLLTLPAGLLIDRKGFKYGVGIGVLFTGLFPVLRLISPESFTVLLISQIGISIGQPFVLNGVTKLAVTWFPQKEEATAVGLGSLALFVGMMVAAGATPALVQSFSFQTMLLVYCAIGLLGVVLFFSLVKAGPDTPSRELAAQAETVGWQGIKHILKIRDFVILGFIALIGIGVFNGLVTWLQKMLYELHQIPMTDGGNIFAILIFSGIIGCIVIPIISDKIMRRKPFLIAASVMGTLGVLAFMISKSYSLNMLNGVILGFFMISALPIMLTMSTEITGARYAGISVGWLQLLGNAAAVIIVPLMEFLNGATGAWILPLAVVAGLLVVNFVLSLVIGESAKSQVN